MTTHPITQSVLTPEFRKYLAKALDQHAIRTVGIGGFGEEPVVCAMRQGEALIGCIVIQIFWGQLHIRYLLVEEAYRGQGHGKQLIAYALNYGKEKGCSFVCVETMNFQAPDFYQKLGFSVRSRERLKK